MARGGRLAERIPARLSDALGRRFGLEIGGALLVLGAVLWWRHHPGGAVLCGTAGALLVLTALVAPRWLVLPRRAWMGLAAALSRVTTPLFMAVVYFVVLTPFGVVKRLWGGNPILRPRRAQGGWVPRAKSRSDMEHQF